jgi:hypothetical protein
MYVIKKLDPFEIVLCERFFWGGGSVGLLELLLCRVLLACASQPRLPYQKR